MRGLLAALLLALGLSAPAPEASAQGAFPTRYDADIRRAVARWWPAGPDWVWWRAQLWQESRFRPEAVSPVGAAGLAQFMPGTWADVSRQLRLPPGASPHQDIAIDAGAYYMARLMAGWRTERPQVERLRLAQASYNAGSGHIVKAQALCDGARDWVDISPCLPRVTGHNARETQDYVRLIEAHRRRMILAGARP